MPRVFPGQPSGEPRRDSEQGDVRTYHYDPNLGNPRDAYTRADLVHPEARRPEIPARFVARVDGETIINTMWGKRITDVAKTYVHNLTRPTHAPTRFERAAVNDSVNASALSDFQRFLEQEGEAFLERVDAWLTAHEARAGASDNAQGVVRLGAGLYHIQD